MKQITVNIPDEKLQFFLELINSLDFVEVDDFLTAKQKEEIDLALEEHKNGTAEYTDWKDVKNNLFKKFNIQ